MNSETFTLPQGAPEVVGTCKLDTHGFNTNDLQKTNFYFEIFIFSIFFSTKTKNVFEKNLEIFEFSKIPGFTWSFHLTGLVGFFEIVSFAGAGEKFIRIAERSEWTLYFISMD